jgi:hypothetical protein
MKFLAVILIMLGACYAGVLEDAASKYLEPGMNIENATLMPLSNGSVYILPIDGQDTLMIGNWSSDAIVDEDTILAILKDGIMKQANAKGAGNETASLVANINAIKLANETQCALYTGTTNHSCTDKESCNVAAQSSPQAQIIIQADGFWQDMLAWYTLKGELNSELADLASSANSTNADSSSASAIAQKIYTVGATMRQIDGLGLMKPGKYGIDTYCPPISWPYLNLRKSQGRWEGISTTLKSLAKVDSRAHDIALASAQWLNYTATRASEFLKMQRALQAKGLEVEKKLSDWNNTFSDDAGLNAKFKDLTNRTNDAISLGNSNRYRDALSAQGGILALADDISKKIDSDFASYNSTMKSLSNSRKAEEKLRSYGLNTDADAIGKKISGINATLSNRSNSSGLAALSEKAAGLETDALKAVAAASLVIETDKPAAQPNASANATNASPLPKAPTAQIPSCPIPFAVAGLGIAGAAYSKRGKGIRNGGRR